MAVVPMQKLSICGTKKKRKQILEALQALGAMEIITDAVNDEDLKITDTDKQRETFERSAGFLDEAGKLLAQYVPGTSFSASSLTGKKAVERKEFEQTVKRQKEILDAAGEIIRLDREIKECEDQQLKDDAAIDAMLPWRSLSVPLGDSYTGTTVTMIGTIPGVLTEEEIRVLAAKRSPDAGSQLPVPEDGEEELLPVSVCEISRADDAVNVAVTCMRRDADVVEGNLRAVGFARPSGDLRRTPQQMIEELASDQVAMTELIEEKKKAIEGFAGRQKDFRITADYFRTRAEKYRILGTIPQSETAFFLEGWVPEEQADRIAKLLQDEYGAVVSKEDIKKGDQEPTLLKNNAFSRSVEGVLSSFGLPKRGQIDPTTVMSFFYVFFFGMMLSDAGYGLLMVLGTAFALKKFPKMEEGLRKSMQMFFWCGLSTIFWGIMYGGFFGDAIDVIAHTFFNVPEETKIVKPVWLDPMKEPMKLLIYCMLFGLIHLFTGVMMKGYECLKKRDILGFFADAVSWIAFILGLTLLFVGSDLFEAFWGKALGLPAWTNTLAICLTVGGLLVILIMSGRRKKNWLLRIALGAYDIYGVTGWLSDILSYSRLLALGMATGVIAQVINMMAAMPGKSVVGVIVFVLVFIVGHLLNLAINALGAYVHTNRLQFVEFFGKFYEGGGTAFKPFKNNNKYIEIKDAPRIDAAALPINNNKMKIKEDR